jgi:hypothetical protein
MSLYNDNPPRCKKCGTQLPYKNRNNKFCSHSCAAKCNNLGVRRHGKFVIKPCEDCAKPTKNVRFCSVRCCEKWWYKHRIEIISSSGIASENSQTTKKYLTEIRGYRCEICGLSKWNNQKLPLILDHINGDSNNRRLENLRLICSNCDSLLPTYKGRNRGNGRIARRKRYADGKSY